MPREKLRSTLMSLWLRLISLGIVGLVFAEALFLGKNRIQGWTFYITTSEVVFEVAVRLLFGALAGIALASTLTALLAPFLWYFVSKRDELVEWVTKTAVVSVIFLDSRFALTTLIKGLGRSTRFTTVLLALHFIFFGIALCIPRLRREIFASLDGFLGEKMTRAAALATLIAVMALVVGEFALSKSSHTVGAATVSPKPKSNILLVTFDALDAEDLSLYGRDLPTTPNIDAFARNATVFTNFYSASSFTTPGIATMLTGMYPSESHAHQVQGLVRAENAEKTLPHAMRTGGYTTAAFLSNPWAYYLAKTVEDDYDFLPEPNFQKGGLKPAGLECLWGALAPLHQHSGIGSRVDEYFDLENLWNSLGLPESHSFQFRPNATFGNASHLLGELPDEFFLWVHVITPHDPYLPDPTDRGRFLSYAEQQTFEDESVARWRPHYAPDQQGQIDRRRLLYDEFVLSADRAFGAFIAELQKSGRLNNTTVIVSADHGESFEGGVFRHESPYLTRPTIHIPLIIRMPGQQQGRTVTFTADQTSLPPTILDLAGLPKPDWMPGQSLASWLNGNGHGQGLAFSQFLEKNSVFKPLRHGTIGVIDGEYQYVLDLDTQKGSLRPLTQAQFWDMDRSAENPSRATALRESIYARFPELQHP
jgi:arylsulfatase A-like enzyme